MPHMTHKENGIVLVDDSQIAVLEKDGYTLCESPPEPKDEVSPYPYDKTEGLIKLVRGDKTAYCSDGQVAAMTNEDNFEDKKPWVRVDPDPAEEAETEARAVVPDVSATKLIRMKKGESYANAASAQVPMMRAGGWETVDEAPPAEAPAEAEILEEDPLPESPALPETPPLAETPSFDEDDEDDTQQ